MLANVGQPVVVIHPNATLRLSGVASALVRLGALTSPTVTAYPLLSPALHRRLGTIRQGARRA